MFVTGSLMEFNGVKRMRRKYITLEPNLYTLRISTPTREWKNIEVVFVAVMFHHATLVSSTIFRHSTLISSEERVTLIENHKILNKKTARRLSNYSTCCRYYHQRKILYNHNHIFFYDNTTVIVEGCKGWVINFKTFCFSVNKRDINLWVLKQKGNTSCSLGWNWERKTLSL